MLDGSIFTLNVNLKLKVQMAKMKSERERERGRDVICRFYRDRLIRVNNCLCIETKLATQIVAGHVITIFTTHA